MEDMANMGMRTGTVFFISYLEFASCGFMVLVYCEAKKKRLVLFFLNVTFLFTKGGKQR